MSLLKIAINNLKVRRSKMLLVLLGMIMGTATIVTLFTLTMAMEKELTEKFQLTGTRILITPNSEEMSFSYRGIAAAENIAVDVPYLTWAELQGAMSLPEWEKVEVVAPKLLAALDYHQEVILALGVDFTQESKLKPYWQLDGAYPVNSKQVVLGYHLAKKLQATIGQDLKLGAEAFTVAGTLEEIGTAEDLLLYISLPTLQQLTNKQDVLSLVEISIPGSYGPEASQELMAMVNGGESRVKASQVKDVVEARREIIQRFARFSVMVSLVVTLIGSLIVGSTMMASVNERTREIGVFRAIGFRKSHIVKIIFFETGILSAAAGASGFLVGMILATIAAPAIGEIQAGIEWDPLIGLIAVMLTLAVGLAASFYPAVKAAKLDPVEALRFI